MLYGVIHSEVPRVWPVVLPMLRKAFERCEGDYTEEDIYAGLLNREYQLWIYWHDLTIVAACVTCVVVYPQRKVCCFMLIGGKGLKFWKQSAQEGITTWAKEKGCTVLEGYDTRSWLRVLIKYGWRGVWLVIRKEI